MKFFIAYPEIDLELTGSNIKNRIKACNYTIRDIQEMLSLDCPQSIYRWRRGETLPSVTNLLALSWIVNCSIEDLLVLVNQDKKCKDTTAE